MPQADACVLKNKHWVNSLPVLLSLQPPSPKTPTHFHSLDPTHSIDIHGKRGRFGAKPIRRAAPPILGAFTPCWEGGPVVWGKGYTDGEDSWALHGFLQEEGADLYISHQPCPHFQEMPWSQPWLLPVWLEGELSLKAGALSPIKSIIASLGV